MVPSFLLTHHGLCQYGLWTSRERSTTQGPKSNCWMESRGFLVWEQSVLRMPGKWTKMGVGWGESRALTPMDDVGRLIQKEDCLGVSMSSGRKGVSLSRNCC